MKSLEIKKADMKLINPNFSQRKKKMINTKLLILVFINATCVTKYYRAPLTKTISSLHTKRRNFQFR